MGFMIYLTDSGRVPGYEYLPCSAIVPKIGMALKMTSGKLAKASGADEPLYISMTERGTACEDGEQIPVVRVNNDIVFEAPTPATFTAVAGGTVQLSTDGCGITSTANGAAEIVYTDSNITRVRFGKVAAAAKA